MYSRNQQLEYMKLELKWLLKCLLIISLHLQKKKFWTTKFHSDQPKMVQSGHKIF